MESRKKRSLMLLSIAQIAMSVLFFILGMIDGLKIRYGYVSLLFTPCWITALILPVGVMGLVLAYSGRPSTYLINAIWSVSVACIVFLATTILRYQYWGMELLLINLHFEADNFDKHSTYFVKKNAILEFTDQEKAALAVFGVIMILSIFQIILTAAIAKISGASDQRSQPLPMYHMYCQPGQNVLQMGRINQGASEIHNAGSNQPAFVNLN